jgi:hypothetical protein
MGNSQFGVSEKPQGPVSTPTATQSQGGFWDFAIRESFGQASNTVAHDTKADANLTLPGKCCSPFEKRPFVLGPVTKSTSMLDISFDDTSTYECSTQLDVGLHDTASKALEQAIRTVLHKNAIPYDTVLYSPGMPPFTGPRLTLRIEGHEEDLTEKLQECVNHACSLLDQAAIIAGSWRSVHEGVFFRAPALFTSWRGFSIS